MGLLDLCQFSYHHPTQPKALGLLQMDTPVAAPGCCSVSTFLRTSNTLLGLFLSYSLVTPSFPTISCSFNCFHMTSLRNEGSLVPVGWTEQPRRAGTNTMVRGRPLHCRIYETPHWFCFFPPALHSLGVPGNQQLSWTRVVRTGLPFAFLHSVQASAPSGSRLERVWPGLAPGPQSLRLCWTLHGKAQQSLCPSVCATRSSMVSWTVCHLASGQGDHRESHVFLGASTAPVPWDRELEKKCNHTQWSRDAQGFPGGVAW